MDTMSEIFQLLRRKGNDLLADLSLRTGLNLNRPTYICAKVTMRCNSHCVHCNIWRMDFAEKELSTAEWLRVLDGLHAWLGHFDMVFTGGEALLRDDMFEILAYAVSKDIRVELLSNSIAVDDQIARRIVETGIAQFTTSFDGIHDKTHDHFRGAKGLHAKTMAAVSSLCAYRQQSSRPLTILLKTVISSNNLEELVAIAEYSKDHGLEVLYQPIEQNYGEEPSTDWYQGSELWVRDLSKLRHELARLLQLKFQGYPIVNTEDNLSRIIQYFESPHKLMRAIQDHDTRSSIARCGHAVTNFVISGNGDVRMCFKMKPIGNLRTASPAEIWNRRKCCWLTDCGFR